MLEHGVMSFGDHLEELRRCAIRSVIAVVLATVLALAFAKSILAFILKPAVVVLSAHGQRTELQALSPPDAFMMYFKLALLSGLIIAMPIVLWEIWRFISLGLYAHEQRFVRRLAPFSLGLFVLGVCFMFYVALPVVLNFFVGFGEEIRIHSLRPGMLQGWLIGSGGSSPDPAALTLPDDARVPLLPGDPPQPAVGAIWFNSARGMLCVQTEGGLRQLPMQPAEDVSAVRSDFGLSYYVSFVLMLSLAFGLAFELPLVIIFLTTMGIVSPADLARWRKYVILAIFIVAAVITPPDVLSQILLAIPMVGLFEGALWISKRIEQRRASAA